MVSQAWSIPAQTQEMGSLVLWERVTRVGFNLWLGTIPWRRKRQISTLIFLPGKSHGQRSLVGYSPWGRKELDTTEQLNWTDHTHVHQGTDCKWKRENFQFLRSEEPLRPCLSEQWLKGRGQGRENWSKGWESQEDLGEQSNWHNRWIILTKANETDFKEVKKVVEHCRKYSSSQSPK